jgi:2-C-methyl-D-erythritol 4-phosphate cytidylyltransferase/2-C-methyl-D-erythritol 2,4-cyclodiphosphate synthase
MNHAILLAGGKGERMSGQKDKMLINVAGKPLIYYSLMALNDHPEVNSIYVVANNSNKNEITKLVKTFGFRKVKNITTGGAKRQQSLEKGVKLIEKIAKNDDIILVHNGANPLPSFEEIHKVIEDAKETECCISGHFLTSTIKEIGQNRIVKTHNRNKIFAAETPQAVKFGLLKKGLACAKKTKKEFTDEAMLVEAVGGKISYIEADKNNFKITTSDDLIKLRGILGEVPEDFRIGIGQDSHMFEEKIKGLVLAGVKIKDELKLKANSDGDVVLHAIFNALSQSIGDMSIGFYADKICKNGEKDSRKYLEIILKKVKKEKFKINSAGIMIECGKPKIDPVVSILKKSLAEILGVDIARIGITATTGEECTVFGEGLGIQCFAIVSIIKDK